MFVLLSLYIVVVGVCIQFGVNARELKAYINKNNDAK